MRFEGACFASETHPHRPAYMGSIEKVVWGDPVQQKGTLKILLHNNRTPHQHYSNHTGNIRRRRWHPSGRFGEIENSNPARPFRKVRDPMRRLTLGTLSKTAAIPEGQTKERENVLLFFPSLLLDSCDKPKSTKNTHQILLGTLHGALPGSSNLQDTLLIFIDCVRHSKCRQQPLSSFSLRKLD